MSRVSLSGNPSGTGTFTISSPNSNTDRTLSLPDQTGTLLTGSGVLNINASAPTSSLTLDASGQLGVGTTSPGYRLDVAAGDTTAGFGYAARLRSNATAGAATLQFTNNAVSTENGYIRVTDAGLMSFTNRAYIDSSGSLLVRKTTDDLTTPGFCASIQSGTFNGTSMIKGGGTWGTNLFVGRTSGAGTGAYVEFWYNGTTTGTITTNGTTTAYNTSSDYRLKEDIAPMTGALAKVAALKPCTYKWKADGSDGEGFIAHELQEVVPQCVTGDKDAVDADGKPVYQGIDTSFLVATLTAAIQELKADLDATKAELAALKGQQ